MVKTLVFDVDGTILDTEKAILNSLQEILKQEGRHYKKDDLRFVLGIPGKEALKQLKIEEIDRVQASWVKLLAEFSHEVEVFEDLEAVFQQLQAKEVPLGIVTSKTKTELKEEFAAYDLTMYFESTIDADDTVKHKPEPDPLLACLDELNVQPDEAIYIGDSIYDMQCAQNAGVKFALALWGAKSTEGFKAADYLLKEPNDVLSLIEK